VPGITVTRFCTSGLDAIGTAAARVAAGHDDLIVAGGVESMSRVPMLADKGAWFADPEVAKRTGFVHMGISADLIATLDGYTRPELDAWALRSHQRAAAAWEAGAFARGVVPVQGEDGALLLERDERIKPDVTLDDLAAKGSAMAAIAEQGGDAVALARYPQLDAVEHLHSSATAPGMVDGAGLVVVATLERGRELGLTPRARVRGYSAASVEPVVMLTAPAPATRRALGRAGMELADVDLFEINESFSATVLHAMRDLAIDEEKVNVHGGAIAMGHPLGASGAILTGTLLDALEERDAAVGVATLCAGAGLGAALAIERV
jgi:acetyl-CoA C-acetyltransferase